MGPGTRVRVKPDCEMFGGWRRHVEEYAHLYRDSPPTGISYHAGETGTISADAPPGKYEHLIVFDSGGRAGYDTHELIELETRR